MKSLYEVLRLKQNFRKIKKVTGKTPFFEIGPFCTPHSICLYIDLRQGSFKWKCGFFNRSTFN